MRSLFAACMTAMTLIAPHAFAQKFPDRPVTIVVPYSAGGPVDAFSRAVGLQLAEKWGQPVIVQNKPGANEIIGADTVAKSPADGYTLFAGTEAALTMSPHLYQKLPYNVEKDFAPVSQMVSLPLVFFVSKKVPANNLKEFIALARTSKDSLTYGSTGTGGIGHLPMVTFESQENIRMVHVPYKGAANLIPDAIAGQIDAAVLGVSVIEQHLKAGTLKALAISADARSAALPDVPTFKEQGVKDIFAIFNIGLVAPKGTPPAVIDKIAKDVAAVIATPDFNRKNITPFSYVAVGSTPAQFGAFLKENSRLQAERIKAGNVVLD